MITLNQVKSYLKINTTTEETFLKELCDYSLGLINGFCQREFDIQERIDLLRGNNRAYLSLPLSPIKEIITLKIKDIEISKDEYSLKNNMVFYPKYFPVEYLEYNRDLSPNTYKKAYNICVTYKCGYIFPEWLSNENTGSVPEELQYCLLEIIKGLYINSGAEKELQSKEIKANVESVKKTYFKSNVSPIPTHIQSILGKYKRGVE
ncbi:MAG: hypothetical protein ACRC4T_15555 [Cetobacterium sp.]